MFQPNDHDMQNIDTGGTKNNHTTDTEEMHIGRDIPNIPSGELLGEDISKIETEEHDDEDEVSEVSPNIAR